MGHSLVLVTGCFFFIPMSLQSPSRFRQRWTVLCPHHIPDEIGEPVDDGLHPADELQVFRFADPLLNQEHNKAGWDKGHRKDDTNRHKDVDRCGHPRKEETVKIRGTFDAAGDTVNN